MTNLHTLVVDDSFEFLVAAVRSLAPHFEVVDIAFSGYGAIEQINRSPPDVVLLDLVMPTMNGLETTRKIKMRPNAPSVIIITLYDTPQYREAAEAAGADGFLRKSDVGTKLLPMIQELFPGRVATAASAG